MTQTTLRIIPVFSPDDQGWMRRSSITVPAFWEGHTVPPIPGDALRVGGRQFIVQARVWEHDGTSPVLRLFISDSQAHSDTVFG